MQVVAVHKASLSLPESASSSQGQQSSVTFDALHAVPPWLQPHPASAAPDKVGCEPPSGLVLAAASALQERLGLQLFGFDLVLQHGSGVQLPRAVKLQHTHMGKHASQSLDALLLCLLKGRMHCDEPGGSLN